VAKRKPSKARKSGKKAGAKPAARKNLSRGSEPLKIALVGMGTVGTSVAKLLAQNSDGRLQLTHILDRDTSKRKTTWIPKSVRWPESFDEVLATDVDVVVELIGGLEPAGGFIRRALEAGKSVVTANKVVIAKSGTELQELARKMGRRIEFGAAVAGGIPVILGIQEGLAGDRLHEIAGILNGTCNFVLTRMEASGASFADALAEAQKLGFAEADPSADVEGFDARAKLVILTQVALGAEVRTEQIPCRPISLIEAVDFHYAHDLDCTIRQISLVKKDTSKGLHIYAAVQPALVPSASLLAHVARNKNMVVATGEFSEQTVFSGYGAGGDPTAVAIVSDLYAIARGGGAPQAEQFAALAVPKSVSGEFTMPHYLRFVVKDRPGILAAVADVLARYGISVDAVLQKPGYPHDALPFVMTLETCSAATLNRALEEIAALDFHVEPPLCLPILSV
jgi:homoserine dehydrogenase